MEEGVNFFKEEVDRVASSFRDAVKLKSVLLVSNFNTDGICSASIMIKTLGKMDIPFSVKIVKELDKEVISSLPKDKVTVFLDVASGCLNHIKEAGLMDVYVLDNSPVTEELPVGVRMLNPELSSSQKISTSGVTYLLCKELSDDIRECSKLAVLGMIGKGLENNIDSLDSGLVDDLNIKKRRGPLIYPATRPVNRALEFSSNPFIPGVTGDMIGVTELLKEAEIAAEGDKHKSIIELSDDEMDRLASAIISRNPTGNKEEMVGDIFLVKMFSKLEDAREVSAKINSCSKLGDSTTALLFCLEKTSVKNQMESIHVKYRQHIVSGLKYVHNNEPLKGEGYLIINAGENIKDTVIGTISGILSTSSSYTAGTSIIGMAHTGEDDIKISVRSVGGIGKNLKESLGKAVNEFGREIKGDEFSCGCIISREKEEDFLKLVEEHFSLIVSPVVK